MGGTARRSAGKAGLLICLPHHLAGECIYPVATAAVPPPYTQHLEPSLFHLLTWTEAQQLSRNHPGKQQQLHRVSTSILHFFSIQTDSDGLPSLCCVNQLANPSSNVKSLCQVYSSREP